ncbi:hypothetical protein B0T26DRAFT_538877 [Lasiosphaeria miniovina]|uniref:Uncharacterized protein n=1 Tax=Lasiosphaeria miniovina TaxID=1954250 RepID=A0AA40DJB3_9PEZI|nr:uncharacterized protein B0T26DRAFT_538877 [Lasiosphaeria miniovina]KAK0702018.1 hypothetical protein B0T26DRAFT_538877 [Lasiosphaeria miniovina]
MKDGAPPRRPRGMVNTLKANRGRPPFRTWPVETARRPITRIYSNPTARRTPRFLAQRCLMAGPVGLETRPPQRCRWHWHSVGVEVPLVSAGAIQPSTRPTALNDCERRQSVFQKPRWSNDDAEPQSGRPASPTKGGRGPKVDQGNRRELASPSIPISPLTASRPNRKPRNSHRRALPCLPPSESLDLRVKPNVLPISRA